ncbi:MAG TPA: alpha/beta hydrolase [Chthoniobacterales bacterium]|nr:alpha/beta hydrolase [Chthoniobacterales bacterium]
MNARTETLALGSGASVALSEYGDAHGAPVFFCHGWPSSRTMAELAHEAANEFGARIISPDRPGIRDSPFQPNRRLLDWPPLLSEIADRLGIGRFRMLAISGGAPYAYASGWMTPERVQKIAVVSGAPPLDELGDHGGLLPIHRRMLALRERRPWLLKSLFHLARPFVRMRMPIRFRPLLLKFLQPCDANVLRESRSFEVCFESARQAWRSSALGVMTDAEIYATPWGFPLEEVRVPVALWHGTKDRTFAYRLAKEVAGRLPNCDFHLIEDAGHYSLPIRHIREILADLMA